MDVKYVLLFPVAAALLTVVLANHRPPPGIEMDTFDFHYDPDTGYFVGSNRITCILVLLNTSERMEVHTTRGIDRIELKMMKDWIGVLPEVMVYRTDPLLSPHILHWCDNRKIILLKRTPNNSTVMDQTPPSGHASTIAPVKPRFSGTPSYSSGTQSVYQQTTTSKSSTYTVGTWSKSSVQSTNMFSTPRTTMTTDYTSETSTGTTTTEVPASATSHHTMKVTTPSVFAPYIFYDNSSPQMNAVVVDRDVCYVYHLSDMDTKLVNMGPVIKDAFEVALLSKDRTNVTAASETAGPSSVIRRTCTGTVFQLN